MAEEETYRYWVVYTVRVEGTQVIRAHAFEFAYPLDAPDHCFSAQQEVGGVILTWKRLD